jgi:hypothetical protein
MTSEMALDDFNALEEDGLRPTFQDAIRLNALALKCESSPFDGICDLPRVAFLGSLAFREPTVGHTLWIDSVLRWCDRYDLSTAVAVYAFALSRDLAALPDANDRDATRKAIDDFTQGPLAPFTLVQIRCAIDYAQFGADATAKEYPPPRPDETKFADDVPASLGAGAVVETLALGFGVSIRDICALPLSKVRMLQAAALSKAGVDVAKRRKGDAIADYYAALNEIKARLKKEQEAARG